MPKANQKRGRRMKRKHDELADDPAVEATSKRQKSSDAATDMQQQDSYLPLDARNDDMSAAYPPVEKAFFGMLDDEEQEYFKTADQTIELNSFPDPTERAAFIQGVWKEVDGKALKLAQSQSCSRLLERLIRIATPPQLKTLFQQFSGNFIHLMSHRFASHCCETLFTCAAPCVSEELSAPTTKPSNGADPDEIYVSMENLFLHTIAELEGNMSFLLTDSYASHALRILLLVLAGKSTTTDSVKGLLQSKKKEGVSVSGGVTDTKEAQTTDRTVPQSFSDALEKLLRDSVAGLDTARLRTLATHTIANPTLQLLMTLEVTHYGKQRGKDAGSIIRTLLPDDPFTADSESAAFISGMVYDPVGSHLVEKIIECAPAKLFKAMYNNFFKERLASYARNEMGTYVDCRILERLGYDDLLDAHEILCPVIPSLLEKQWTSLTRTMIERCTVRDIDTQAIAVQIEQTFRGHDGFDITSMLKMDLGPEVETKAGATNGDGITANGQHGAHDTAKSSSTYFARPTEPSKLHFNILAQAMLIVPGSLSALVLDSMIGLEATTLVKMAQDHIITRTLQQALTTKNASMIERRKLIQRFYGNIGDMALDKAASHVVDCIWEGTHGLAFIRERIAEELAENEAAMRESPSGRAVWKNWKMDMYKRKRSEWIRQSKIKASNDGFQSFSELDQNKQKDVNIKKTPLQLARERHMQDKAKKTTKEAGEPSRGRRPHRSADRASQQQAPAATASL